MIDSLSRFTEHDLFNYYNIYLFNYLFNNLFNYYLIIIAPL